MIQHFQYESLYDNKQLPGWSFSFYFKKTKIEGNYLPDGKIEYRKNAPEEADLQAVEKQIHDLMIYHVYDQQR